jgi:hypothetical protein
VPIEDDFTAVSRYVEVADGKLATEIGQLPLASGLEVDEPELLVRDVSFHDHQLIFHAQKGQPPGAPRQYEVRQVVRRRVRIHRLHRKRRTDIRA